MGEERSGVGWKEHVCPYLARRVTNRGRGEGVLFFVEIDVI